MKKAYIFAGITILLWSTMATVSKLLLNTLDSFTVLCISSLFAALFLMIVNIVTGNIKLLKGYSLKDIKSKNSNFAFISKVNLTEPVTDTRMYGESIAKLANTLGDGKPIVQTLKDLRNGRRSEWHRINKGFVEPTLKDCVAGDLALVLPHRILINILEGLEKLDKILPGINNGETLLYGPEIKFFSNEITTDNEFKLENDNIYFVGDGAGKAGNIVAAAATGLVAARSILKRLDK